MKKILTVFALVVLCQLQILSQTVSEGVYIIRLAANPSFVVGVNGKVQSGANIALQSFSTTDSQKWHITHKDGAMIITCVANGSCAMDVWGGQPKVGSNIACHLKHDGNNQKWYAEKYGNGYVLRSALNRSYVLDLDHAIAKNGQNILLWSENKGKGQIWKIERIERITGDEVTKKFEKFFGTSTSKKTTNNSVYETKPTQFQRSLVKTWREIITNGYVIKTKYNDGWLIIESHNRCTSPNCYNGNCTHQGLYSYMNCPNCHYTNGKCVWCKGTGEQVKKVEYLEVDETYGDNNNAISVASNEFGDIDVFWNGRCVVYSGRFQDAGSYWKYNDFLMSKNLKQLIVHGTTYNAISHSDFNRIYTSLKKHNNIPSDAGRISSPSISPIQSQSQTKQCPNCLGTGQIPFSVSKYGSLKNSTNCFGEGHVCNVQPCQVCKKNHCVHIEHISCDKCGGYGTIQGY